MGSQGPRVIRLSDSAPPSNYDALESELNGDESRATKPQALNVMGSVKEKGFSTEPVPLDRFSFPQPRVTSFPVARHRSEGPHWGPPSFKVSSFPPTQLNGDDEGGENSAVVLAEPLHRRKNGRSQTSQWRSSRKSDLNISMQTQNVFDDARQTGNAPETSTTAIQKRDQKRQSSKVVEVETRAKDANGKPNDRRESTGGSVQKNLGPKEISKDARQSIATARLDIREVQYKSSGIVEKHTLDPLELQNGRASVEERNEVGEEDSKEGKQAFMDREIDAENRNALFAMSSKDVAAAQAELTEKMRPELLELLRKRGAAKERKRLAEKTGAGVILKNGDENSGADDISGKKKDLTDSGTPSSADLTHAKLSVHENIWTETETQKNLKSMKIAGDQTAFTRETVRGTKVGPADLMTAAAAVAQEGVPTNENREENTPPPPTTDPWTLRVEAVRSMRFDLNGNVISVRPAPSQNEEASQVTAGATANSQHSISRVVERDFLRTEGDPVGTGYSVKDAVALVRSTVPGQRAFGLRLIASVLDKAIQCLQNQKFNPSTTQSCEGIGGSVDWQAIWAYALGPEAELVLTLRLALDDGHSTVVAASARAMQALLSYSSNESYFDSLEGLWPGDEVVFTAPIFRRKTKQNEGFIGGGRWKYNVKSSEMFPFSSTAAPEEIDEDGKDTVADDGHISNKDVAAGLIRMGVLPRIRYILEVDKLIAAEESLLSVLICIARHSPTAAHAVMKCPRLIDTILQSFIGTDGHSLDSWSVRLKSIRLLKVLSQAKRSNLVYFEGIGAFQAVIRPLLLQGYGNQPQDHAQDLKQGYYETMIETVRFWRVCINYGIGVSLFFDCYSTLCFWLLPLSKEEILRSGKDGPLLLALESYMLLEHLARTLPILHAAFEPKGVTGEVDTVNWSWSVAQAMVDTAMKWISPECISGIQVLLEQCLPTYEGPSQNTIVLKSSIRKGLGTMAAVLHFLATVCEKIVPEKKLHCARDDLENFSLPWLPTFLPQLGLVLARSGLLNSSRVSMQSDPFKHTLQPDLPVTTSQSDLPVSTAESDLQVPTLEPKMPVCAGETRYSLLECLHFCQTQADHDTVLVAINFVNALVRVSSIVDKLIQIAKPKAIPSPENQTVWHKILGHGLLPSAEMELRKLLVVCKETVIARNELLQMNIRGGPAPGLGIGWGAFCGGAWSKELMIAQASARLAIDLMSVFSSNLWPNHLESGLETVTQAGEPSEELSWGVAQRVNFGLTIVATSTAVNKELVHRVSSSIMFHPSSLLVLIRKIEEALPSLRGDIAQEDSFQGESHAAKDQNLDPEYLSKVLLQHTEIFWLAVKTRKDTEEMGQSGRFKRKNNGLGPSLATVDEEPSDDYISHPESLMREWVGQRLPLPSHWFLSPMVVDLLQASRKDWENGVDSMGEQTAQLEEVIKAGLVYFLGFELLAANVSEAELISVDIPLVRKIHSLSTTFITGGDVFLHTQARDIIRALQSLIGDQIGKHSTDLLIQHNTEGRIASKDVQRGLQTGSNEHDIQAIDSMQDEATTGVLTDSNASTTVVKDSLLDFEGCIDASYLNYAEVIAEQFVATSYGDLAFARQVALHLCLEVPHMIRLATWRVLTDGRVLELLPPLGQCCGPPQIYLHPVETNQQILDSFVSAWSSGALDRAAKRNSVSFTLALHHLASYFFDTINTEETLLLKKKALRTLIRSSIRKLDCQEMLSRLVHYAPAWPSSNGNLTTGEADIKLAAQLKSRLLLLSNACQGDGSLTMQVQHLQKLIFRNHVNPP